MAHWTVKLAVISLALSGAALSPALAQSTNFDATQQLNRQIQENQQAQIEGMQRLLNDQTSNNNGALIQDRARIDQARQGVLDQSLQLQLLQQQQQRDVLQSQQKILQDQQQLQQAQQQQNTNLQTGNTTQLQLDGETIRRLSQTLLHDQDSTRQGLTDQLQMQGK